MVAVCTALSTDGPAYECAFDEAHEWLTAMLRSLKPHEGGTSSALALLNMYAPYIAAKRALGPPASPQAENGLCDGGKAIEGFHGLCRKDTLLLGERTRLGDLAKPSRVLLTGSRNTPAGLSCVRQWVQVPQASSPSGPALT